MAGKSSTMQKYVACSSDDQRMLMDLLEVFFGNGGSISTFGGLISVKGKYIQQKITTSS